MNPSSSKRHLSAASGRHYDFPCLRSVLRALSCCAVCAGVPLCWNARARSVIALERVVVATLAAHMPSVACIAAGTPCEFEVEILADIIGAAYICANWWRAAASFSLALLRPALRPWGWLLVWLAI